MPTLLEKISWRFMPGYYTAKATEWALRGKTSSAWATALVQRAIPPRPLPSGPSRFEVSLEDAQAALAGEGLVHLGVLDRQLVDDITAYAGRLQCTDPWCDANGRFAPSDAPANCHVAEFARGDLARSPSIMRLANDPTLLALARAHLGATPTISNLTMWWSFAGRASPRDAQLFHRDRDDSRFCKAFFYLTDVDMDAGPHVYVRGSARRWALRDTRRLMDEEVVEAFGENSIEYVVGERGTAFIADTSGVHKGLLPTRTDRLVLQVEYSLLPIGRERYERDTKLPTEGDFDRYVNRLLVEGASRFTRPIVPWG